MQQLYHQSQYHSQFQQQRTLQTQQTPQFRPLSDSEIQIGDNFILNAKIKLGSGAFGDVYLGYSVKSSCDVAIKLEPKLTKHPQLFYEGKLYSTFERGLGIPTIHWKGTQGNYNILIMDSLGPSLENLFVFCKRKFTLRTTLLITMQLLTRIEFIHSRYYIHRDIKPDNFVIGKGKNKNLIYAIDFGLAKRYKDPITDKHIPYKEGKNLTGTARYTSINTHLGIEQARRDDIEALGYIMVYFMKGELPWQGLKAKHKKEKYEKIKEKKINTTLDVLCEGCPYEIQQWIEYSRNLVFEEKPDYEYLRGLLQKMEKDNEIYEDEEFDWIIRERMNNEIEEKKENIK